ncbi:helix-turn-helix domain-containing protein [Paenalcaligenes niemegkensis]|nr:helix-turn-helix domain-containing protein [Paenalcaligenes niemegkensis]MCQ9618238.1 helix-turn-helix domain-containing protein [Paenalcaligenes niemegkensis]
MSTSNTDSAASGTVIAVARALTLLQCFTLQDGYLSLAELSKRSALHKTTVLRLARTLAEYQYLVRRHDGAWRLGSAAGWLGARYQASLDLSTSIEPVLKKLAKIANESATFFVKEDHTRVCLYRAEGPLAGRHYFRIGQSLPLEIGSPGKTILAFSGEQGEAFEAIRKRGITLLAVNGIRGSQHFSASVWR